MAGFWHNADQKTFTMQKLLILAAALCWLPAAHAQTDREGVYAAIEDYVDALYRVQPERIQQSVHPQLTKKGFWRPQGKPDYQPESIMTYTQLYELAGNQKNVAGRCAT